jgi:hypothetical protein
MFEKPVLPLATGELEGVTPFVRGTFQTATKYIPHEWFR